MSSGILLPHLNRTGGADAFGGFGRQLPVVVEAAPKLWSVRYTGVRNGIPGRTAWSARVHQGNPELMTM
jgi:hypothetical protein